MRTNSGRPGNEKAGGGGIFTEISTPAMLCPDRPKNSREAIAIIANLFISCTSFHIYYK
jgi:hypothetical protein